MTEQQIRDGYDRLDDALAPPPDVAERVQRRVVARRRRRLVAVTGATTLAAVVTVGTAVALSGGNEPSGNTIAVDQPPEPHSTLVMTRPDGSTYAFPDVSVTCDPPEGESTGNAGPRIWATSPRRIRDDRAAEPFIYFSGIVSKIERDRTFTYPNDWSMGSAHEPMILFLADSEGSPRGNEVSTAQSGTTGTVRVLRASCGRTPVLELEVDATLGSEVDQGTVDLAGALR